MPRNTGRVFLTDGPHPAVEQFQYIRNCTLLVSDNDGDALDLSELHIKFSVKRSNVMTPNVADIRVYNLAENYALAIKNEFTRVILQGGYDSNFGVIFQGNIKQVIISRESAVDTYIDIQAGDGDLAYNFAVVNTTIEAGATADTQINAAITAMTPLGVTKGYIGNLPKSQLPRGKVMYGNAREYLRQAADTTDSGWSVQDGQVEFLSTRTYLPGEAVVLTSKTGMIGTPQQTNEGVNIKCLMNPLLRVNGRVMIDNKSIAAYKLNLSTPGTAANIPPPINADGVYYIMVVEHSGDNRGVDWYTSMVCLNVDLTTNPFNSVQVNYG